MITVDIPGKGPININSVVLDYNGTIAKDGQLLPEVVERVNLLKDKAEVFVLTADTYGNVRKQCEGLPLTVKTFPSGPAAPCKEQIVKDLGEGVFAVGNGFNDIEMLEAATIGVAVLHAEGVYAPLIAHADILVKSPADALDLLLLPDRLRATLRW